LGSHNDRANSGIQKVYQKAAAEAAGIEAKEGGEEPVSTPAAKGRVRPGGAARRRTEGGKGSAVKSEIPTLRYADIGGVEACIQDIRELIEYPLLHPEIYSHLGVEPPRGVLLHGPPGSGKTMLAQAVAAELSISKDVK